MMIRRAFDAVGAGWRHPYVRFFGLLLLTAAAITGLLWASWCDCDDSNYAERRLAGPPPGRVYLGGGNPDSNPPVAPGARTERTLGADYDTVKNPTYVEYWYTPPPGATNFSFPTRPPDEILDDGTMVWENVPVGPLGRAEEIDVNYDMPQLPANVNEMKVHESVSVWALGSEAGMLISDRETTVRRGAGGTAAETVAEPDGPEGPAGVAPQADDYYLWETHRWARINQAMTTETCQEWMDFLREGTTFVAMRFPLLNATGTATYTLPIVMRPGYFPELSFLDHSVWPPAEVFTASLECKPAYHTFLANELPQKEGEKWVAMGVAETPPITCPEGLNLAAGEWEFYAHVWLDLGGEEDACDGCTLPLYICYEGQDAPIPASAGFAARAAGLSTAYQGWGITCLGPGALPLNDLLDPGNVLYLKEPHGAVISATERITYHHTLWNLGDEPMTVSLTYSSTQGIAYGFYQGGWDEPDMPLEPVAQPVALGAGGHLSFWLIGETPADAQGEETIIITARSTADPNVSAWISDLVWIGPWEPPDLPLQYYVYLPVVHRE